MTFDYSILDDTERITFALRELYLSRGYSRYKMSKFEEYDLYARHKDFLVSDAVITFTDTNGKLLALKPDVTLSIIKNNQDEPEGVRKLCYNENVYRVSRGTNSFKELMQTGLECMGAVDGACVSEVLMLAAETLKVLSTSFVLEVSDLDILSAFTEDLTADSAEMGEIIRCIQEKNFHGLTELLEKNGTSREKTDALIAVLRTAGSPEEVLPKLETLCRDVPRAAEAVERLEEALGVFWGTPLLSSVEIDLSSAADMNYYNGVVFRGYIDGVPESVLSGGQYDVLMRKMGRKSGAIGFAVYLDLLERITLPEE